MGLENALSEITLVLFTSLAPSGAVAIAIVAAVLAFARLGDGVCAKMNVFLCVPLIVTMVGLVASATHLGNPANALYVFMGVGRSPLSNEVFSAVMFLGLTGVYWLYSFSLRPNRALQRMWLCAIAVFAAAFVFSVGQAYSAETVITWDTAYGPAGIVCTALLGGPLLAVVTLRLAGWRLPPWHSGKRWWSFQPWRWRVGWRASWRRALPCWIWVITLFRFGNWCPPIGPWWWRSLCLERWA